MPALLERIRDQFLALLPPGRAYSWRSSSNLADLAEGLCEDVSTLRAELDDIRTGIVVANVTTETMLRDWEEALDMPVPGQFDLFEDRRRRASDKLRGRRAYNLAAYQAIASEAYSSISVKRYAPFEAGRSAAGANVYGDTWQNVITVTATHYLGDARVARMRAKARAHGIVHVVDGVGGGA